MAEVTVTQFAEVLKVPVDRLLAQLDQAGIKVSGPDARITDDAKLELLTHLRRSHGSSDTDGDGAPRKITLKRKTQSELKLAGNQGRARTVNVEVRRTRNYIKRDVLLTQAIASEETLDQSMPADDLLLLEGMSPDLALTLARRGVRTREDLAEQSVDELADIEGLAAEKAAQLIMTARAPWFEAGN